MEFPRPLIPAVFLERRKRFLVDVELETGERITAHCPNPGSMASCFEPGGRVLLLDHPGSSRKLPLGWELSRVGETWILVNTLRVNAVVREALEARRVPELAAYGEVIPEVRFGERSRVDFLLREPGLPDCYLEVKSATLEHQGLSYFPDGVTTRGTRHLQELVRTHREGHRAVLLFLVSRADTDRLRPAARIDPDYAACLRASQEAGLEVLAYRAAVSPEGVELTDPLPLELDPELDDLGPLPRGKLRPNRPRGGWSLGDPRDSAPPGTISR